MTTQCLECLGTFAQPNTLVWAEGVKKHYAVCTHPCHKTGVETSLDSITRYVELAMVTANEKCLSSEEHGQVYGALSVVSEGGEIAEIIKKRWYHGHPWTEENKIHLIKEMGDIMWGIALLCRATGIDPAVMLATNIAKLKARYPEGFTTERSINRAKGDI